MRTKLIIQNLDTKNITKEKKVIHFKIQSNETNFL
jgi:hypothetical protein